MNYYQAKFERERKPFPTEWVIVPTGFNGNVNLVHVGGRVDNVAPLVSQEDADRQFLRDMDYGMMP